MTFYKMFSFSKNLIEVLRQKSAVRRVFSDVHAAGENDQNYFLPAGKKLCEAFFGSLDILQNVLRLHIRAASVIINQKIRKKAA